jgi:hypothetical protein
VKPENDHTPRKGIKLTNRGSVAALSILPVPIRQAGAITRSRGTTVDGQLVKSLSRQGCRG